MNKMVFLGFSHPQNNNIDLHSMIFPSPYIVYMPRVNFSYQSHLSLNLVLYYLVKFMPIVIIGYNKADLISILSFIRDIALSTSVLLKDNLDCPPYVV